MNKAKPLLPLFAVFIIVYLFIYLSKNWLLAHNIIPEILMAANIFFWGLNLITLRILRSSMNNKNPNKFVQAVLSSLMLKMFLTIIAVLVYKFTSSNFSEYTVFAALFIYLFYLIAELILFKMINYKRAA